ncbi:MAG: hypothetical protein IPG99_14155 [Ignavibacteria bacterium]|nr:hypothetical protein [Ignavibacteria bacterium]
MKTALLLLLALLFVSNPSIGQEYYIFGSQSACETTGDNPFVFKYNCKTYLNVNAGIPECSEISADDPRAQWEVIQKGSTGDGSFDVDFYLIKNRFTETYLNIEGGVLQCNSVNPEDKNSQWYITNGDNYFFYWLGNMGTEQTLVFKNGTLGIEKITDFSGDKGYQTWYYFTPDKLAGSGSDPVAVMTDPTVSSNTSGEAQSILERHNYWRAQLGIAPLSWSDELASYAQQWANELSSRGCQLEHRPRDGQWKQMYGENLYWAMGGKLAGTDAVESWAAERKDFDHNTQEGTGGVVGHYTQMIWENTTKVRCAKVVCSDGSVLWVCNYDPPGNWSGEKPYMKK